MFETNSWFSNILIIVMPNKLAMWFLAARNVKVHFQNYFVMTYRLIENCIMAKRYPSLGKKFTKRFKRKSKSWHRSSHQVWHYSQMSRQFTDPARHVTWSKVLPRWSLVAWIMKRGLSFPAKSKLSVKRGLTVLDMYYCIRYLNTMWIMLLFIISRVIHYFTLIDNLHNLLTASGP